VISTSLLSRARERGRFQFLKLFYFTPQEQEF
jgi:hypothetical protein